MPASTPTLKAKTHRVYRLRAIPSHYTQETLEKELRRALPRTSDEPASPIVHVYSLGRNWNTNDGSKSAVIYFYGDLPPILDDLQKYVDKISQFQGRIDDHFLGLTTIHTCDAATDLSKSPDIIFVHGLSGHALGSFIGEYRGRNGKPFAWPLDSLKSMDCRVHVWGYDSELSDSTSFQTLDDLGQNFLASLRDLYVGDPAGCKRPIILIGVSLGGLVIQKAITRLADTERHVQMLKRIGYIAMFGVPKQGILIEDMATLVQDQPNRVLIDSLQPNSPYLRSLQENFDRVMKNFNDTHICSYYETKVTPRLVWSEEERRLDRSGPQVILVSQESATLTRTTADGGADFSEPINNPHHQLVKFTERDDRFLSKIITQLTEEIKYIIPMIQQRLRSNSEADQIKPPRLPAGRKDLMSELRRHSLNKINDCLWDNLTPELLSVYRNVYRQTPYKIEGTINRADFLSAFDYVRAPAIVNYIDPFHNATLSRHQAIAAIFMFHISSLPNIDDARWRVILKEKGTEWSAKKTPAAFKDPRIKVLAAFDQWVKCICHKYRDSSVECGLAWNLANDEGMCWNFTSENQSPDPAVQLSGCNVQNYMLHRKRSSVRSSARKDQSAYHEMRERWAKLAFEALNT